jgi:hypothetical protein
MSHKETMNTKNKIKEKSIESLVFKLNNNEIEDLNINRTSTLMQRIILVPPIKETQELYSNKVYDISYGDIDLRKAKMENLFEPSVGKIVERISGNHSMIADCTKDITDAVDMLLKNIPLLVPNKSASSNPSKWYIMECRDEKWFVFGKTVSVDFDENYMFEKLEIKDKYIREKKLDIIRSYHNAMRSRDNITIKNATNTLVEEWYNWVLKKHMKLITEMAHKIYWTPLYVEALNVHQTYFRDNPIEDWLFYPLAGAMRHNFSVSEPDKDLFFGPPIKALAKTNHPGNIIVNVGTFFRIETSFFGGKIAFHRNGKKY